MMRFFGWSVLFSLLLGAMLLARPSACGGENLTDLFDAAHITEFRRPKEVKDFSLPDIHGNPLHLSDLRGKIVLLNFWAMWCGPCVTEMPSLETLHRQFQGRDFRILAISLDLADIDSVRAFVERHQYSFTVLHDPRQRTMDALRERRIPVTFVLNRSGKAIGRAIGLRDWSQPAVIRLFEELLKPSERGAPHES